MKYDLVIAQQIPGHVAPARGRGLKLHGVGICNVNEAVTLVRGRESKCDIGELGITS